MHVHKLDFDTDFFGFGIAALDLSDGDFDSSKLEEFIKTFSPRLIQVRCNLKETTLIGKLEDFGFRFSDIRVSFSQDLTRSKDTFPMTDLLQASKGDIAALRSLAAGLFRDTRYFQPPFSETQASEFYALWVEKAVLGTFDDLCLKVVRDASIAGFVTLKLLPGNASRIGLIGVDPKFQNEHIGTALIQGAVKFLKSKSCATLQVSTQGTNKKATNFYEKTGFLLETLEGWYYLVLK